MREAVLLLIPHKWNWGTSLLLCLIPVLVLPHKLFLLLMYLRDSHEVALSKRLKKETILI